MHKNCNLCGAPIIKPLKRSPRRCVTCCHRLERDHEYPAMITAIRNQDKERRYWKPPEELVHG